MDLSELFSKDAVLPSTSPAVRSERVAPPYYNHSNASWLYDILVAWKASGYKKARFMTAAHKIKPSSLRQKIYAGKKYIIDNFKSVPDYAVVFDFRIEEGDGCFFLLKDAKVAGIQILDADNMKAFDAAQDFITDYAKNPVGMELDLVNPDISDVELDILRRMLSPQNIQDHVTVIHLNKKRIQMYRFDAEPES